MRNVRGVADVFRLIDADGDGVITLTDFRDIASWTSDDGGMEFVNRLVTELQPSAQDSEVISALSLLVQKYKD